MGTDNHNTFTDSTRVSLHMDRLDSLRRRGFLGGTLAAIASTAGCFGSTSENAPDEAQQIQQQTTQGTTQGTTQQTTQQTTQETDQQQQQTAEPNGVPEHAHTGPESGGARLHPEVLLHRARDTSSKHASAKRPIISTEPKTVYVNPNGNDSNPGTRARPLATLQEALDRAPLFVQHKYHIKLADGTYVGDARSATAHLAGSEPHSPHPIWIEGNPQDPSRVVLDGNPALSVRANEMDNPVISDLTVTGTLKNADSHFMARNIRFTGTGDHLNKGAGFKAHNPSVTILRNCTFTNRYESAVDISLGGHVMIDNCRGNVSGYAIKVEQGSTVTAIGENRLSGDRGFVDADDGGRFVQRDGTLLDPSQTG